VTASFAEELNMMEFEVAEQIDRFHEMEAKGSRITV
jgi:hypothetical protein